MDDNLLQQHHLFGADVVPRPLVGHLFRLELPNFPHIYPNSHHLRQNFVILEML